MHKKNKKLIKLYEYLKEISELKHRGKNKLVIKDYKWKKYLNEIPSHEKYVKYYPQTMEDNDEIYEIFELKKPLHQSYPIVPNSLDKWIKSDLTDYTKEITNNEYILISKTSKVDEYSLQNNHEHKEWFNDDQSRIKSFDDYKSKWNIWANEAKEKEYFSNVFDDFYKLKNGIENDSDNVELILGQGILIYQDEEIKIEHPILLKNVRIKFDSKENTIKVVSSSKPSELYTFALNKILDNAERMKLYIEENNENEYHPIDKYKTPDFLKNLIRETVVNGDFYNSKNEAEGNKNKSYLLNNPILYKRERIPGTTRVIENIISEINKDEKIPSNVLLSLIDEMKIEYKNRDEKTDLNTVISSASGESRDVLLTKNANKEQLQITQKLIDNDIVLVQGPPGTGKTHTIANITGHLLAEGKTVLITSHTKKALKVLKDKIPSELQALCVSMLDDNKQDMQISIEKISEKVATTTLTTLEENINKYKKERLVLFDKLDDIRNRIFSIKNEEYNTLVFEGKEYSVIQAAEIVGKKLSEYENLIPGKIEKDSSLPLTCTELNILYETNGILTQGDEIEMNANLPNPSKIMDSLTFETYLKEMDRIISDMNEIEVDNDDINTCEIDFEEYSILINGSKLCNQYTEKILITF